MSAPFIQPNLPLFLIRPDNPNIAFLVRWLYRNRNVNGGWFRAKDILHAWNMPASAHNERWLRELANKSLGHIAGGQRGYKLVRAMTNDEYQRWRNWMTHQADEMKRRVIEGDKVFFRRKPVGERTTDR